MRLLLCLVPFVVLCTMNSATYRYGASDQAFYQPAVLLNLDPDAFPRDAPLIRAQAHLTLADETIGVLARLTGTGLPALFAALYVGSLLLLAAAAWLIASRLYRTTWASVALLAALTLRHAISRTGTNTLEGYFHPRQLAFALGALAIAAFLRRRLFPAGAAVAAAAAVHPTTAMWFAVWLAAAAFVSEPRWRRRIAAAVAATALVGIWTLTVGPLAGRLAVMDAEWVATLATKDYLFPLEWPAVAWIVNLTYLPVILIVYRRRRAAGQTDALEGGLARGALALAGLFAVLLPLNAAHVQLAVQLQPARMFWMLDFLATIYLVWAMAEGPSPAVGRARLVAAMLVCVSLLRGGYVALVEFPERPLAQFDIADNDWGRAMAWARSTDERSGWLADPMHAVLYGTSIRVAAGRDVLVEAVKDSAVGLYDRATAIRTRDAIAAAGDFSALDAAGARALGAAYDLDYLIAERDFDLPVAFPSGRLRIYRLR